MSDPTLLVIIASVRPVRLGGAVGTWFAERARAHGGFQVEVADLREIALPLSDEPNHPRTGDYVHAHTRAWSEQVRRANAVAIVSPEYNHSFPAALKNAIDYLHDEWLYKPVGLVTYGGISGGLRCAQALKPILSMLKMWVAAEAVTIPWVIKQIDGETFTPTDLEDGGAGHMLDELAKLTTAALPLQHH